MEDDVSNNGDNGDEDEEDGTVSEDVLAELERQRVRVCLGFALLPS